MKLKKEMLFNILLLLGFAVYLQHRWPQLTSTPLQNSEVESPEEVSDLRSETEAESASAISEVQLASSSASESQIQQTTQLKESLRSVPQSQILVQIFEVLNQMPTVPEKRLEHKRLLEELKSHPTSSFEILSDALNKLPRNQFAFERAGVLQLMEILPGKKQETKEAALREALEALNPQRPDVTTAQTEAERDQALSSDHASLLPILASEVFLHTASDFEEAFEGTLKILSEQRDPQTRKEIALKLYEQFPNEKERIQKVLGALHIDLSNPLSGSTI